MHYVLVKDFSTFMYDHTLHHGRKHFSCYCLKALSSKNCLVVILKIALELLVNKC